MTFVLKIIAVVAISISLNAHAHSLPRKEIVLDTGRGGFALTLSVPEATDGPFDFARNKGPWVTSLLGKTNGEVAYALKLNSTAVVYYKAAVFRDDSAVERNAPYTVDVIAQKMIKHEGFVGQAVKVNCHLEYPALGVTTACYVMKGKPVYETRTNESLRKAVTVVAVTFDNSGTQGYALIGTTVEKDAAKFDADASFASKNAMLAAGSMWRYSRVERH